MGMQEDKRPDPLELLKKIKETEERQKEDFGKLKIFFGYSAGVGKTFAMLEAAHDQMEAGVDVVVGYVEPHTRPETNVLLHGLSVIKPKQVTYKNIQLQEFDLDAALKRKPQLILVDELAHTNAFGVRNKKRYQDIEELLRSGIDVYTTVNVQHIESLNDIVAKITNVSVNETIPDYIFDRADSIELVDIDSEELISRLKEGKIYREDKVKLAQQNFFTKENLRLLREIAMRRLADRISAEQQSQSGSTDKFANENILACISPSPFAAKSIRWAARTAEAFHCNWTAIYVETGDEDRLSLKEKEILEGNMALADKLGAKTLVLHGNDVAETIAEFANISGITNIVIGKSRKREGFHFLGRIDFEDKLISLLDKSEIHILSNNESGGDWEQASQKIAFKKWMQHWTLSWTDTSKMASILLAATLASYVLQMLGVEQYNLSMVYLLGVIVTARMTNGYVYGACSSLISVILFDVLFILPVFDLKIYDSNYLVTFIILLLIALITSSMIAKSKIQSYLIVEREQRLQVLYDINRQLLKTRGLTNITAIVNEYIGRFFNRSVVFYTKNDKGGIQSDLLDMTSEDDADYLISRDEQAVANWVFQNNKIAGSGTDTLSGAYGFYLPIASEGEVRGVLGIDCKKEPFNHENRATLQMISSLISLAMERQELSDKQRETTVENEREKMRSNLLRSISHDLRTPLTGILGASSAILENEETLDKETQRRLLHSIQNEAQWLIRLVENLLSVTRIQDGSVSVIKTDEIAEEVIAGAISRIKKRFPNRKFRVSIPDEALFVPMDATLIMQVLINLMENAVKFSPEDSTIDVFLHEKNKQAVFAVVDYGTGIADEEFPFLFEPYKANNRKNSDSSRGMGIGLSICMTIVQAHGGKMKGVNRIDGGAVFEFTLPLDEE